MIQSIVVCAIGALGVAAGVWTIFGESPGTWARGGVLREIAARQKAKQDFWNRLNAYGDGGNGCT